MIGMRARTHQRGTRALTLIELIVVIAVMAVLIGVILPWITISHRPPSGVYCANQLKAIGSSFRIFANDNEDLFPMRLSTNRGGTKEFVDAPFSAFRHFQAMSNELSTPKILVCPEDKKRTWATNWSSAFGNQNLSYFVGLEATDMNAASILSGDRYLESSRKSVNGFLVLTTSDTVRWAKKYHAYHGNLLFSDGSVRALASTNLQNAFLNSGSPTNRLALPE